MIHRVDRGVVGLRRGKFSKWCLSGSDFREEIASSDPDQAARKGRLGWRAAAVARKILLWV